jgi:hypothetical protein
MFDLPEGGFCRKSFGCNEAEPDFSKSVVTTEPLSYHGTIHVFPMIVLTIAE